MLVSAKEKFPKVALGRSRSGYQQEGRQGSYFAYMTKVSTKCVKELACRFSVRARALLLPALKDPEYRVAHGRNLVSSCPRFLLIMLYDH